MPAFILSLREGLEAALIIGIVLGALKKLGRPAYGQSVWLGVVVALVGSVAVALGLNAVGAKLEGRSEQIFEGALLLLAAAVLTWMIFWMQGEGKQLKVRLTNDVRAATNSGTSRVSLSILSFAAVFREGVELALFLVATTFATSATQTLIGASLGLIAAAGLGMLIFAGTVRLDVKVFFRVTSLLLIVFAAGMVAYGFHELIEAGLLPAIVDQLYNVNGVLDDGAGLGLVMKTLFGYNGNPALTETIAYIAYFGIIWLSLRRRSQQLAAFPVRA